MEADQEPQIAGPTVSCFGCFSSKRGNERKKKSVETDHNKENWEKKESMLSDMSTFSVKEQERRLKKALEEEGRVTKQAERVVHWIKQESARMDDSSIKKVVNEIEDR